MDPERNIKKLHKLFGVSHKIQKLSARRGSAADHEKEEIEKKKVQAFKDQRQQRISNLGANHRYVLEIVADFVGISTDQVIAGLVDDEAYTDLLNGLFKEKGNFAAVFSNATMSGYPVASGRYVEKLKYAKIVRLICYKCDQVEMDGYWVVSYRNGNTKNVETRSISDEIGMFALFSDKKDMLLNVVKSLMQRILKPSLDAVAEFGLCEEEHKAKFFHGLNMYNNFISASDETVQSRVIFEVSHSLFKGLLLAKHQIEASSKIIPRVRQVERYFAQWLRQIQGILVEGKQIQRDASDAGPLQILVNWRRLLTRYSSIIEFVSSRAFVNHKTCLVLSRSSKLLKKWTEIDGYVTLALNEAKDNVRYISSLQKFWDPLYRSSPDAIVKSLPVLMVAIRNVCKTAHFFNTPSNITGLFVKITNQLTITSKEIITDKNRSKLWNVPARTLIDRIENCRRVMNFYKSTYFENVDNMKESNEKPWVISSVYIFTNMEKFLERLGKISVVFNTELTYAILDTIKISGMEKFAAQISSARATICKKPYDPLDFRIEAFDKDFDIFVKAIESAEMQMQQFVKAQVIDCPMTESVILILKRFEKLNLNCLCLDRRYLEVCEMLGKEMVNLKDVYNLERGNPLIPRNAPPFSGRIKWIRAIFRKIDEPMKMLKDKPCVIGHKKSRRTVQYYNYMAGIISHYEMTHHKAWFEYAEEVRCHLNAPVLTRQTNSAKYRVNLHESIFRLVKETEAMTKMNLEVPNITSVVTYCKDRIFNPSNVLQNSVRNFDDLRRRISPVYINFMRFRLRDIMMELNPGLSKTTWLSENFESFAEDVKKKVDEVVTFYDSIMNIEKIRVTNEMESLSKIRYVYVPTEPVSSDKYLEESNKLRQDLEKTLERKSVCMERAVIDVINMFVDLLDFPPYDSKNRRVYQLPPEKINDNNWRTEGAMPIDKYDWIQFSKIYRVIYIVPDDVLKGLQFRNYENLRYELSHLRNDCMDLFSYYNMKMIMALVQCSKRSLDFVKYTILKSNWRTGDNKPILYTNMDIDFEKNCFIEPNIEVMQTNFHAAIQVCTEINYFVTNWGRQAKTYERKLRRVTVDENRHERTFFKYVVEHNHIIRAVQNLTTGLYIYKEDIEELLIKVYEKHKYLWAEDRYEIIHSFVRTNPLTIEIRDKFVDYENITSGLEKLNPLAVVGAIEIRMHGVIAKLVEESKKWKITLGQILSTQYKKQLNEIVNFINEMEFILSKPMKGLEDVRVAMNCLEKIRDNSIQMDFDLGLIEDTYDLFSTYNIAIPQEDYDKVDGLQLAFNNMMDNSRKTSARIAGMDQSLMKELDVGIGQFVKDFNDFNDDFDTNGPMIEGISGKEASDRVLFFQNRFDELWRKFEIYESGEKLFGLPITDYPLMHQRKKEIDYLNQLYSHSHRKKSVPLK